MAINLKDVFGVEKRPVQYKHSTGERYFLIKGKPGSHQVSEDDVNDAEVGYGSLPDAITEAYKPHELFWLAVAAAQYSGLITANKQPSLKLPQAVKENLEGILKKGMNKLEEGEKRTDADTTTITLYNVLSDMDRGYDAIVKGVSELLDKKKKERDLKGALSLAVFGMSIQPPALQSEELLNNVGAKMPYRPYGH